MLHDEQKRPFVQVELQKSTHLLARENGRGKKTIEPRRTDEMNAPRFFTEPKQSVSASFGCSKMNLGQLCNCVTHKIVHVPIFSEVPSMNVRNGDSHISAGHCNSQRLFPVPHRHKKVRPVTG